MKKARVILWYDCPRNCPGCCNTYYSILGQTRPLYDIVSLASYDEVLLTGGEPMLNVDKVIAHVQRLRAVNPKIKIYLYTALHTNDWDLERVLQVVDGIQFSLHKEANHSDIEAFYTFQRRIATWADVKSFRLYVDQAIKTSIYINPRVWKRVEIKPWMTEKELLIQNQKNGGLPQNEDLYIMIPFTLGDGKD